MLHMIDAIDFMRSMQPESVDMVFTDPPYRVHSGGTEHSKRRGQFKMHYDNSQLFAHNDCAIADYLPLLYTVLKPGSHCYVMTNNLNLRELLNRGAECGFHFHNLLRWDKSNVTANRWYMKDCEHIVFFGKPPAKPINHCGSKQGFKVANIPGSQRIHPTEKPIDLVQHYIENSSAPGDLVFDPFAGSGSTALAAIKTGRRWISCEIDPTFYLAASLRIGEVLAGDNSFPEP